MEGCGLKHLRNFPSLKKLQNLVLNKNDLKDGEIKFLAKLDNLKRLELNENNIIIMDSFNPLKRVQKLKSLYISGNPVKMGTDEAQMELLEKLP